LPADVNGGADAKGRERFQTFVEALAERLNKGQTLLREIPDDVKFDRS
jgi:hypothetical protein